MVNTPHFYFVMSEPHAKLTTSVLRAGGKAICRSWIFYPAMHSNFTQENTMSSDWEKSKVYDDTGKHIATDYTRDYNGGTERYRLDAYGAKIEHIDEYPDGSTYDHKGARLRIME